MSQDENSTPANNPWQLIEPDTKTKGRLLLGWWNQTEDHAWVQTVGFWNKDHWTDGFNRYRIQPTHWAPLLPEPLRLEEGTSESGEENKAST